MPPSGSGKLAGQGRELRAGELPDERERDAVDIDRPLLSRCEVRRSADAMRAVRVGLEPVAGPDRRQDRVTVLVEVVLSDQRDHFFASEQRTGHREEHSQASTIQNTSPGRGGCWYT